MKKHLFKKSENSMVFEPKPFPPSSLPEQRGWLHSRLLPPRTQDSLILQFPARGLSSHRTRTSAFLRFFQLSVAEDAKSWMWTEKFLSCTQPPLMEWRLSLGYMLTIPGAQEPFLWLRGQCFPARRDKQRSPPTAPS